jgi:putative flippase GtrA
VTAIPTTATATTATTTTTTAAAATAVTAATEAATIALRSPELEVVIPVHDEERDLTDAVVGVRDYLVTLPYSFRITVADNASTDGTAAAACRLSLRFPDVAYVFLPEKGRGRALKHIWSASDGAVLVYMDADLSTDLNALLPLVAPLLSGHSDIAIGTRLARGSRTVRGAKRELISRTYNLILRGTLRAGFSDAQCGFKAVRADVARELLPLVRDDAWFFDTELLVLAERAGLRIHEVPVDWVDDPDSRVDIWRTARDDVMGIARVGANLARGRIPVADVRRRLGRSDRPQEGSLLTQLVTFGVVGALSTVAYAVLYLALRAVLDPQLANALALAGTAVVNTAANRRFTFGVRGREGVVRHHAQGLLVFAVGLAVTSGSLWVFDRLGGDGHPVAEVALLTVANLLVTVGRFLALRTCVTPRG